MGKMLEMPECDEADMYAGLSCGHRAGKPCQQKTPAPDTGPQAFYDEPGSADPEKVFWECPCSLAHPLRQNIGRGRQRSAGYPGRDDQASSERKEQAVGETLVPNRP